MKYLNIKSMIYLSLALFLFVNISTQQFVVAPANATQDFVNISDPKNPVFGQVFDHTEVGYMWAGYLNVTTTRSMYYYFTQKIFPSTVNPINQNNAPNDTADVLVWLSGGPGCSSLGGAFLENGPLRVQGLVDVTDTDIQFVPNPYSWNHAANVLYIESGPGVGFSMKTDNGTQNDTTVAENNMQALILFLEGFYPNVKKNVWITGESYAGVYVPYMVNAIDLYNSQNPNSQINLQGWMAGNPCTNPNGECDNQGNFGSFNNPQIQTFLNFGYINQSMVDSYTQTCANNVPQCQTVSFQVTELVMQNYDPQNHGPWLNEYDLKRECLQELVPLPMGQEVAQEFLNGSRTFKLHQTKDSNQNVTTTACIEFSGLFYFFNQTKNRQNMHVVQDINNFTWYMCTFTVQSNQIFNFQESANASLWIYEKFIPMNKYKILVYSGDTDAAVATWGTINWINKMQVDLQLNFAENRRTWFYSDETTQGTSKAAGTITRYSNNFNFITVFGVGHLVPRWASPQALTFVSNFIEQNELPYYEY